MFQVPWLEKGSLSFLDGWSTLAPGGGISIEYLGVLFTSDGWSEHPLLCDCCAGLECKVLNLLVDLHSKTHLWSWPSELWPKKHGPEYKRLKAGKGECGGRPPQFWNNFQTSKIYSCQCSHCLISLLWLVSFFVFSLGGCQCSNRSHTFHHECAARLSDLLAYLQHHGG